MGACPSVGILTDPAALDEPLSALDARVRVRLREEIKTLQHSLGVTTIMVTHDQEEALAMADSIVVMNRGRVEQIGAPTESMGVRPRPSLPTLSADEYVRRHHRGAGSLGRPGPHADLGPHWQAQRWARRYAAGAQTEEVRIRGA